MNRLFEPKPCPELPIRGADQTFPVHRIFCVGRNYVAHATEMGSSVDREAPWYFSKSSATVCQSGSTIDYPLGTSNLHYEIELVVALGAPALEVSEKDATEVIYGFGSGIDLTRRDRQQEAKDHRRPWTLGKDFENSAVLSALTPKSVWPTPDEQNIWLCVNGATKQQGRLSEMVWGVPELISHLSHFYHLQAGDIIMTGTPAGVGPLAKGDVVTGGVDGLDEVNVTIRKSD